MLWLKGIFLVFIILFPALGATRTLWSQESYLVEAVLSVESWDLTGNGREEVVLTGRNYERMEAFVYVLGWQNNEFRVLWKSPNLYEPATSLIGLPGVFRGDQPEILVLNDNRARLYSYRGGQFTQTWEGPGGMRIAEVTAADVTGDGRKEVLLSEVVELTGDSSEKRVAVLRWTQQGLVPIGYSPVLGNIRALASGDLLGFGRETVAVESGRAYRAGEVILLDWSDGKLEILSQQSLRGFPIFALDIGPLGTGKEPFLVLGDDRGRMAAYRWVGHGVHLAGEGASYGWALADLVVGKFSQPGQSQVFLARFPSEVRLLTWELEGE